MIQNNAVVCHWHTLIYILINTHTNTSAVTKWMRSVFDENRCRKKHDIHSVVYHYQRVMENEEYFIAHRWENLIEEDNKWEFKINIRRLNPYTCARIGKMVNGFKTNRRFLNKNKNKFEYLGSLIGKEENWYFSAAGKNNTRIWNGYSHLIMWWQTSEFSISICIVVSLCLAIQNWCWTVGWYT